jgi:uncharacterized membrane protein (DUF4010 family)
MTALEVFTRLGIALALGLLVGLQRERVQSPIAGIRTFALITVLGAICGLLSDHFGGWIIALGVLAVAALLVVANLAKLAEGRIDPGLTTEMAVLLMFGTGAYLMIGHTGVAVAVGGSVAILLYLKQPLHTLVARIGEEDLKAIMQFVLIALVILPVLPNENYGPYEAFNPYKTWWMVVLIVAISLAGYIAFKFFGQKTGALLAGVLGGLISSTATTVSQARRVRDNPEGTRLAAVVILIASTIAFARVMVEIAVVAPGTLWQMLPPLGVMFGWMAVLSAGLYWWSGKEKAEPPQPRNPAELQAALIFGALYALVRLAVVAAEDFFGTSGLYLVGILSGLHDMDAITLSTAQLVGSEELAASSGWRVILTAALSNLVFKAFWP